MKRRKIISKRNGERGVVVLLVAVFLLFVVGAMAALAIDLVTFYTARSEAQLAADGAALAGARVIANSGMTSNPSDIALVANVELLARTVATQVAVHNKVGGRNLIDNGSEIVITIGASPTRPPPEGNANPQVTVRISRTDLSTFFARIWGRTQVTVTASATAEAYNPSGLNNAVAQSPPVAPVCVKPWALPNIDPISGNPIFDATTGDIKDPTRALLGGDPGVDMTAACADCSSLPVPATKWKYYPGASTTFPAPTQSLPTCGTPLTSDYQRSVAGCVQTPISCSSTVDLSHDSYGNLDAETAAAVNCLTHSVNNKGDSLDLTAGPNPPFQYIAGDENPLALPTGTKLLVSDSLVTVPVIDHTGLNPGSPNAPVIGFVQLFLNPDGLAAGGPIKTRVVNLVGCGTNATGVPVQGNGGSAVAVRLIAQ